LLLNISKLKKYSLEINLRDFNIRDFNIRDSDMKETSFSQKLNNIYISKKDKD